MERIWSRPIEVTINNGIDYWEYFGHRLVENANILPGARILDIGCGSGSSLLPAATKTGLKGFTLGIDICPS